jgi:subfamily B ATP-binding cassette protein MsbA
VTLEVHAGEVLALVGASGSGKTTLVNLIPRFFEPSAGAVYIDATNIRDVSLRSLRRQIAIVSQETVLFDDTIAANIAYGAPGAARERVIEVARAAYADGFITQMPQGYDTPVGERGVRLSGGERQRIAIARALLKDPPILILDEATSNLDSESELVIQKALENLFRGRTTFVIAHRLATIRNATRIVVLEAGRIVEVGRHDELLAANGTYKRLYEIQYRNPSPLAGTH